MQPNLKIIDQGYSKQKIIYSQTTKNRRNDFWYRLKNIICNFLYPILRFFGLPTPPCGLPSPNTKLPAINLVSSFEGNISKILFAFPSRYFNNPYDKHAAKIQQEAQSVFSKIINTLDVELDQLFIITEQEGKHPITEWLYQEKIIRLNQVDDVNFLFTDINDFTVWIQDPIAVGKNIDTGDYFIKTPSNFKRDNDDKVGLYCIKEGNNIFKSHFLPISNPPLPSFPYFEGGNMLIGDNFWLLGMNDLVQGAINLGRPYRTQKHIDAMKELYNHSLDARELILVKGNFPNEIIDNNAFYPFKRKNSKGVLKTWYEDFGKASSGYTKDYQPIFHIDMFISLVGRENQSTESKFTILVGSPKLAFKILTKCYPGLGNSDLIEIITTKKALQKNINYEKIKQSFIDILDKCDLMDKVIVETTKMFKSFKVSETTISAVTKKLDYYKQLQSNMKCMYKKKFKHAQNDMFEQIANSFDTKKFNVIRTPLPFIYEDNTVDRIRQWYYATSNNVLVQNTTDNKQVFLPTYGHGEWEILKWTDKANYKIWSDLGYNNITMLPNFQAFAYQLGAMHCIIKTLERN